MVFNLGIRIERLYLDRAFSSVDVIRYLKKRLSVSVTPIPKKGDRVKFLLAETKNCKATY